MVIFTYKDYRKYRKIYPSKLCEESMQYTNNTIKDKHDKLYRDFLNDSFEFSQFLKRFLNLEISEKELINYNNAFITEDYKNRRSDIVYKIKNKPIYIFIEHQSSIDHSINYRILEYYYYILKSTIDVKKLKNKNYKFPVIIPILFYTGRRDWNHIANIVDKQVVIKENNYLTNKLEFPYEFVNIQNYTIEKLLEANTMISYAMAINKSKTEEELSKILNRMQSQLTQESNKEHVRRILGYTCEEIIEESTIQEIIQKLKEKEEKNMQYGLEYVREDILRKRKQAQKEGRKEGRKEGILEGIRKITKEMLRQNMDIKDVKKITKLSETEINKIKEELKMA